MLQKIMPVKLLTTKIKSNNTIKTNNHFTTQMKNEVGAKFVQKNKGNSFSLLKQKLETKLAAKIVKMIDETFNVKFFDS